MGDGYLKAGCNGVRRRIVRLEVELTTGVRLVGFNREAIQFGTFCSNLAHDFLGFFGRSVDRVLSSFGIRWNGASV